ncbi:MAG: DUF3854 domain-containing protein, partial [Xenococcaceae cyanobacterium MO_234.B1]|nr:DUF3854 domain-containing protein [Xenococcaceae cyanobacterium MO_234.B1]
MISEDKHPNNLELSTLFKDSITFHHNFGSISKNLAENSIKNCYGDPIQASHWQEWTEGSGISPFVTSLNLESEASNPLTPLYDRLLISEEIPRRNPGQVTTGYLKRYQHLENGGWASFGVNVLSPIGEENEWGVVKPDCPRISQEGKPIKYEVPPKVATEIFAPHVSFLVSWHLIRSCSNAAKQAWAERLLKTTGQKNSFSLDDIETAVEQIYQTTWSAYNHPSTTTYSLPSILLAEDKGFYQYVIGDPIIPIVLTEGNKKAAKLITEGFVTLSVPGVFNGYRKETDSLIPQLEVFAVENREIVIGFDQDSKEKTIANVNKAIAKTGKLFEREGCKVSVLTWDYPEKGVDDLIVAHGSEVFRKIYEQKYSLAYFLFREYQEKKLNLAADQKQTERYIKNFDSKNVPIVGIKAPKGTGKTELLTQKVAEARDNNQLALVITHRIQLARTLCDRFGIDHIEEIRLSETGGVLGYGLCVDSLHAKSKAQFKPEDWAGAVVIIDEVEQVLWHTLDSKTCKLNRVAIIENLTQLLQLVLVTGGKIYLSDADLSSISLEYIQKISNCPTDPLIVENNWEKEQKIPLTVYDDHDPRRMVLDTVIALENGEKAFFQTSGQKIKSKWGTQNLEKYFKKKLRKARPDFKILRIDAESVADPNHPAFGCINNLDTVLSQYDLVLASPVIETGISIDLKKHFDRVWCIAYGIQTVDSVCQGIERVRDGIPRSLWAINKCPQYKIGNGATYVSSLMRSQEEQATANIALLLQPEAEMEKLGAASLTAWAKRACYNNAQRDCYREAIVNKLLREGYELARHKQDKKTKMSPAAISKEIRDTRDEEYKKENQAIALATTITNEHLLSLKKKRRKTQEERRQERKGELTEKYKIKVTPELVEKDDKGWFKQLKLHFLFTKGRKFLSKIDQKILSTLSNNNKIFIPDINKSLYSVQ